MPPKPKITREMILETVLEITRRESFEAVNARSIADSLHCSTRPIFTCYENMEAMKREFLDYAFDFYESYVAAYDRVASSPALVLPLSYIHFAREETHLFHLIFVRHMALDVNAFSDFYQEPGNVEKARIFSEIIGVEMKDGKEIFLDLFLYAHGIAVLTAEGRLALDEESVEKMTANLLAALISRKKEAAHGT